MPIPIKNNINIDTEKVIIKTISVCNPSTRTKVEIGLLLVLPRNKSRNYPPSFYQNINIHFQTVHLKNGPKKGHPKNT